ncbi:MAG: chemotaxis protein CheB [Candidatus Woesearchaeota archaeon]
MEINVPLALSVPDGSGTHVTYRSGRSKLVLISCDEDAHDIVPSFVRQLPLKGSTALVLSTRNNRSLYTAIRNECERDIEELTESIAITPGTVYVAVDNTSPEKLRHPVKVNRSLRELALNYQRRPPYPISETITSAAGAYKSDCIAIMLNVYEFDGIGSLRIVRNFDGQVLVWKGPYFTKSGMTLAPLECQDKKFPHLMGTLDELLGYLPSIIHK